MLKLAASMSRLGTESAFEVLARANALAAKGHDIINLGIGQPDFKTPDHIVQAGIKALADGHHGYTPANGLPQLREAVANDLETRHGAPVNPDNVVVVPGGKPTMFFAVLMFGEPGAEIMYPNPGFPIYESVIKYTGATPVPIELSEDQGFAFSAQKVLSQITENTRLIIINSPANPTGGVTPKAEIDALVAGLQDHPHVALMSDEIYSQMLYGGREHVSLLQYPEIRDRLIVLDGWSKTYAMTGWRLGYAVWPDQLVDQVTRLCINDHSCVNASAQFAGLAALTGPMDAVHEMVAEFDRRRQFIVAGLNDLPGVRCADAAGA
ncbi:MAG: aminotransferase class I/II-fold pyridoxal phosphate-dependent enzyme, partial [Pseudomonadota bacterium]|nr:aminotransferase class I/II-fold pyridoxal phosphate-dependent enzyme [Pseudomonadota bacterium]